MNRAVGARGTRETAGTHFAEGHAAAGNGKWGGIEYNCSCVLSGQARRGHRRAACEHRQPQPFLHDNGAAKLTDFCRGVWTRALASSRQRDDKTTDSPANQRNGMTAAPVATWGESRRQAVKRIAGVSVKLGLRSESGQFWECSALERSLRSGRLAERPKAGRSHG